MKELEDSELDNYGFENYTLGENSKYQFTNYVFNGGRKYIWTTVILVAVSLGFIFYGAPYFKGYESAIYLGSILIGAVIIFIASSKVESAKLSVIRKNEEQYKKILDTITSDVKKVFDIPGFVKIDDFLYEEDQKIVEVALAFTEFEHEGEDIYLEFLIRNNRITIVEEEEITAEYINSVTRH